MGQQQNLNRLAGLLKVRPHSAREVARVMRCSVPTVYRRIEALRGQGVKVSETATTSTRTGPAPVVFHILKAS